MKQNIMDKAHNLYVFRKKLHFLLDYEVKK